MLYEVITNHCVELRVGVMNYGKEVETDHTAEVRLYPKNISRDGIAFNESIGSVITSYSIHYTKLSTA